MKTTSAAETLTQFRKEIEAELEQLESELAREKVTAREAEERYRAEAERWQEIRRLMGRAMPANPTITDGIAGPLYDRVEGGRDESLRELNGRRGTANSRVRGIEHSIENRRLALRQIEKALAPTEERANVVEIAARPKKKAVPIEFETIVVPEVTNATR